MEYRAIIELLGGRAIFTSESLAEIDGEREKNAFLVTEVFETDTGDASTRQVLVRWSAIATVTNTWGYR